MKIGQARCKWCGYKTSTGGIIEHLKHCKKNPDRTPDLTLKQLNELADESNNAVEKEAHIWQESVERLQSTIIEKDKEIAELKDAIKSRNILQEEDKKEIAEQQRTIDELKEFLKDHEQWEADFISENSIWWPNREKDVLNEKLYEDFLELQEKRNKLLKNGQ